MIRQSVITVQKNKNVPRIWIEGLYLIKAGFNKGDKISVKFNTDSIVISKNKDGERIVCGKKTPIIDLNNSKILQVFNIADKIQVIVELGKIIISKTKLAIRKLTAIKNGTIGEFFAGGGLLSQALKLAGFNTKWAIEKESRYADVWQKNHSGIMYNSDIAQVDFDKLEKVEIIAGGIPCENFSIARQNKNTEAESMDLALFSLMIIERLNPNTVMLEEVPMFLKSEIGIATIKALERLGYKVKTKIVSGNDYGEIQNRNRVIIIASYDDIAFPQETKFTGSAKDFLLDPSDPECNWFTKESKPHMFSQKDGKFQAQIITENTTSIQGIPKRYMAFQKANPLVKHPMEEKWRLLTISELRIIFGLSPDYDLGEFPTYAGEVLGQGVLVKVFKLFAESIKNKVTEPIKKEIVKGSNYGLNMYM